MRPSPHGLLVLDKPAGLTSRDAVNRVQRRLPRGTRVGHTGTLDPLATGVLVVCVGQATRLAEYVQDMDKVYRSVFRLGARSDTDDADGDVRPADGATAPDRATIDKALAAFVGEIEQVPPAFSAAKVSGRRAYDLARKGRDISLAPRRVRVYGIDVLAYEYPRLEVEVRCGRGTYIRSLARDLGERLGCGALVEALRRTRVGPFTVANAVRLDGDPTPGQLPLLPLAAAVKGLPRITLGEDDLRRLRHGQAVAVHELPSGAERAAPKKADIAVFSGDNTLAAVAALDLENRVLRPGKVLSG